MVPQSQEVHKVFVEQINPLKSKGQKHYKCTLETPVLMLWFKVLRAFLHLRDYFCSLHPRYLQGKLSLPLVDLFYIKRGDSKGYGKEQNISPEKQANPLIPRESYKISVSDSPNPLQLSDSCSFALTRLCWQRH